MKKTTQTAVVGVQLESVKPQKKANNTGAGYVAFAKEMNEILNSYAK